MTTCPTCGDTGWLCKDHTDQPWAHGDDCGAPGVPCCCNRRAAVQFVSLFDERRQGHEPNH